MAWIGHSAAAYAMYMPVALAGMMLPYSLVPEARPRQVLLGFAVLTGALSEVITSAGLGAGYAMAAWAVAALMVSAIESEVRAVVPLQDLSAALGILMLQFFLLYFFLDQQCVSCMNSADGQLCVGSRRGTGFNWHG